MDKFLNPVTPKIMRMHQRIRQWLDENRDIWIQEVDEDIANQSGNEDKKIRTFQTFFENPEEALTGKFKLQALREKDIIDIYPDLLEKARNVPDGKYLYIFNCNSAGDDKTALRADSYV